MYPILLPLHSAFRWLVLGFILFAIYRALRGIIQEKPFSTTDNAIRHWTATTAHLQLLIGILLYTQSPLVTHFWKSTKPALNTLELTFYGLIHMAMMLISIVILTIGSALAKRKRTDKEKFKTMLVWFSIALLLIFAAIPWTFSPLSNRPHFRPF